MLRRPSVRRRTVEGIDRAEWYRDVIVKLTPETRATEMTNYSHLFVGSSTLK